jgi:hypothetical protein
MKQHQRAFNRLSALANKKGKKEKKQKNFLLRPPPASYIKSSRPTVKPNKHNLLNHLLSHRHPSTHLFFLNKKSQFFHNRFTHTL